MYLWIVEVIIGVCALIGLQYGAKKIILYHRHKEGLHAHDWRVKLDQIAYLPLAVLLWIVGAAYVLEIVGTQLDFPIALEYLSIFRKAAAIVCLMWLFFRWKNEYQMSLLAQKEKKVDVGMVQAIGRLSTVAVIVLTGLILLQAFGLNIAPLLAFGSVGAAALGFAGKDVIANFWSGLMLNLTQPFIVGDQILLPEKNLNGIIEEIGWFRTLIRDTEKRAVYLPNSYFSTQVLINVSRMTHRHFKQRIRIPFEKVEQVDEVAEKVRQIFASHPKIDKKVAFYVHLDQFGESFAEIEIEAYSTELDQDRFYRVQQELLLQVFRSLREQGVELSIPELALRGGRGLFELQELNKR